MRLLKGTLPTEGDVDQAGLEIGLLSERESTVLPQLREIFRDQVRSAENQLRIVRADLRPPSPRIPKSAVLRSAAAKRWETLNTTLTMAEAYCS